MIGISINLFCSAIVVLLLVYYLRAKGNESYSFYFSALLVMVVLLCFLEAGWYYLESIDIDYSTISFNSVLAKTVYIADYILTGLVMYCWAMFVDRQLDSTFTQTGLRHVLIILPVGVIVILSLLSYRFDLLLAYDDPDFRGPAYPLFFMIICVYMLVASMHALFHAARSDDLHEKRRCRSLASFSVFPFAVSIIQLFVDVQFTMGVVLALIWVILELQRNEMSEDFLTGLNNRNSLDRELAIRMESSRQSGRGFYMLLMDADDFKKINDHYGHSEGDKALASIGDALKKSAADTNHFIARFGGDEFSALMYSETDANVVDFIHRISENISSRCNGPDIPYRVSLSIGYARFNKTDTAEQLYAKADKSLYEEKRRRKAESGSPA